MLAEKCMVLRRDQIDDAQWDAAVGKSPAPVYHYSWFLDAMNTEWIGLVEVDIEGAYTSIFPIQFQKRYGVTLACQNPFFPRNGLFQVHAETRLHSFAQACLKKFMYVRKMVFSDRGFISPPDAQLTSVLNYQLKLEKEFMDQQKKFSANRVRDLRSAQRHALVYLENADIESYIAFHDRFLRAKIPGLERYQYQELRNIFRASYNNRKASIAWVKKDNLVVAGAILLFEKDTVTYYSAATNPIGRQLRASTFLICQAIRKYRECHNYFDFNGGRDVSSLNHFYASFGATPEHFWSVTKVAFPMPFRILFRLRSKIIRIIQIAFVRLNQSDVTA